MEPIGQSQYVVLREISDDQTIKQFNDELNEIATDFEALAEIQQNLAAEIHKQGEQISAVDQRVAEAAKATFEAKVTLEKGESIKSNLSRVKVYAIAGGSAGLVLGLATCLILPPIGALVGVILLTSSGASMGGYLGLPK